jgi:hypothetical protein
VNRSQFAAVVEWAAGRVTVEALRRCVLHEGIPAQMSTKAVYVAYGAHGDCCYVGSVARSTDADAVRHRMAAHDRIPERYRTWAWVEVVPLHPASATWEVRSIEAFTGFLLDPQQGARLPQMIPLARLELSC